MRILTVLLGLLLAAPACAADRLWPSSHEQVEFSLEYFQWKEFLLDGSELLEEKGPLFSFSFSHNNLSRPLPGVIYSMDGTGFLGRVAYEGYSQDSQGNFTPLSTNTDYLGLRTRAMAGQRYGFIAPGQVIDLTGGVGIDLWVRSLNGARDEAGQYASGYREIYRVTTLRGAVGLYQRRGKRFSYFQLGIKYPVDIWEYATIDKVTLHPQEDYAFFATLELGHMIPLIDPDIGVKIFYDSYRFKASDLSQNYYQPKSNMDLVGVSLTF